ncbi:SNF2 family protein, partial [Ostertagia ostertagi]
MSAGGSLKLSISLNRGISSTTENSQIISDEKMDEVEARGRVNSTNSDAAISAMGENSSEKPTELLNVKIPTATKAQKRKHIQTNFDDSLLLSQPALDAQRKEKERLERLERQKQSLGENWSYLSSIGDDSDPGLDSKKNIPPLSRNAPKAEPEVIELSSGDEDEKYDGRESSSFRPYRVVPPLPSGKRSRWMYSDKDRADHEKMEKQHKMEKERMRRRRNSHELEKIELTQTGRHGPEDPDVHVSPYLTHILQPHQLGGVRFLYDNIVESLSEFKSSPGFGCILAHSMGLGKTIQVITFIEVFLRVTEAKKVLVIVPINTIQNWYNEFEKWIPRYSEKGELCRQFEVFLLGDSVKTFDQRVNLIEEWSRKGGVLLIGYEMFRLLIRSTQPRKPAKPKNNSLFPPQPERPIKPDDFDQGFTADGRVKKEANDSKLDVRRIESKCQHIVAFIVIRGALIDPGADLVVCDEGHKIKNLNTDIASALGAIKTRRRIVLTGYPLQNNLMEYYCMVDFVRPDFLGSRKTFSIQFEKPIKNGQCIDSTARDIKIARQRIHVLNSMLKDELTTCSRLFCPESKEFVLLLRKSPLQHALYRNFVMYANSEISSGNTSVFNPLKAFAACSKIWNHPDILAKTLERKREERRRTAQQKEANDQASDRIPSYSERDQAHNMTSASSWQSHEGPGYPCSASYGQDMTSGHSTNACSSIPGPSYSTAPNNTWNSTYSSNSGQTGPSAGPSILEQTLKSNLSEPSRVTHSDLWSGVFATGPPSSLGTSAFVDTKRADESPRSSSKLRRTTRLKPKTIQGVMEEEFDITENDQGLQYDW